MTGLARHELAKWLAELLKPVFRPWCVSDSITFSKYIRNCSINSSSKILVSFDIVSFYTNVPLRETTQIYADALCRGCLGPASILEPLIFEFMNLVTEGVEFSFEDIMYAQIDEISMGIPLGPSLANTFIGLHESLLFEKCRKPYVYLRYVDDTFAIFDSINETSLFQQHLNSLYPSLFFTVEEEENNSLSFLDVLVERKDNKFITSVFRKPTFTCIYTNWNSFVPRSRKANLITTLVHRALMIYSPCTLQQELDRIRCILLTNGYPANIIKRTVERKIENFSKSLEFGLSLSLIYLKFPWLGRKCQILIDKVSNSLFYLLFCQIACCFWDPSSVSFLFQKSVVLS